LQIGGRTNNDLEMVVGSVATTLLPFAASSREGNGGLTWLLSSELRYFGSLRMM